MFRLLTYPTQFIVLFLIQVLFLCLNFTNIDDTMEATQPKVVHIIKTKTTKKRQRKRYPLKNKKLVVLLDGSLYSHSIYKGDLMGFEYELLHLFAQENELALEVKVIKQTTHLVDSLQSGAGDIAAASLNITPERQQKVDFTSPFSECRHRLIQQKGKAAIHTPADLNGKVVMIRKNSSYLATLESYAKQHHISLKIEQAPDTITDENLMEMVAEGKIDFTVVNGNLARAVGVFYDKLDYTFTLTEKLPVSWAVYKDSEGLLPVLNQWLAKRKGTLAYNLIVKKYSEISSSKKKSLQENFPLAKAGYISPYDDLIKKNAGSINWDWKLIAAQVFQESRFDPAAKSWVGATGLMQLMPATAKELGLREQQLTSPEHNIQAGIKYLKWLEKSWQPYIQDKEELKKFVLASYNVGLGHVWDAVRLAEKYHLDIQKWEGNVEQMLLKKSDPQYYKDKVVKHGYCRGKEPVIYVKNILTQYSSYKNFLQS